MECIDAQAAISAALDRDPVDANLLAQAKEHCRSCESCNAFVRTLAAVHRMPTPEPAADFSDRVMARVRAESALAAAPELEVAPTGTQEADEARGRSLDLDAIWKDPRRRAAAVAWLSAAAVVIVVAGVTAIAGVRQILVPPVASEGGRQAVTLDSASVASGSQPYNGPGGSGAAESAPGSATVASAPTGYIVVNGTVYRYAGLVQGVDTAALTPAGSATTALDSPTDAPTPMTVLGSPDLTRVYVTKESSQTAYAFDRVTRLYKDTVYVLKSGEVARFGEWPTLPSDIPAPSTPDGAPTFTPDGTDPSGLTVYRRPGTAIEVGIAIAPGSPGSDPAGGNPNWTWWIPIDGS